MEFILTQSESIILLIALIFGYFFNRIGLAPLVGYLLTGFFANYFGLSLDNGDSLEHIAEVGVYLLLFIIGLKINLQNLVSKKYIWLGSSLHSLIFTAISFLFFKLLIYLGVASLNLDNKALLIVSICLCFSSTVFAVKLLENRGEMESVYGQTVVGCLVIQDIIAVVLLTVMEGKELSPYAALLLLTPLLKPIAYRILDNVGHEDLMVLFALVLVLVFGVHFFENIGLQGDLGALCVGMFFAKHKKSKEILSSIFYIKELFLIFFFVTIGLRSSITPEVFVWTGVFLLLLPLKLLLFLLLFKLFGLNPRSNFFSSISLSNYSEFGFIISSFCIKANIFPSFIIIALAIALSFSFFIFLPVFHFSEIIFFFFQQLFAPVKVDLEFIKEHDINVKKPLYLVLGMGAIGSEVYDHLSVNNKNVVGIDHSLLKIEEHLNSSRKVILKDATDTSFSLAIDKLYNIEHIFLCMPYHNNNIIALQNIKKSNFRKKISAICVYDEELALLEESGVNNVIKLHKSAGIGFISSIRLV